MPSPSGHRLSDTHVHMDFLGRAGLSFSLRLKYAVCVKKVLGEGEEPSYNLLTVPEAAAVTCWQFSRNTVGIKVYLEKILNAEIY